MMAQEMTTETEEMSDGRGGHTQNRCSGLGNSWAQGREAIRVGSQASAFILGEALPLQVPGL